MGLWWELTKLCLNWNFTWTWAISCCLITSDMEQAGKTRSQRSNGPSLWLVERPETAPFLRAISLGSNCLAAVWLQKKSWRKIPGSEETKYILILLERMDGNGWEWDDSYWVWVIPPFPTTKHQEIGTFSLTFGVVRVGAVLQMDNVFHFCFFCWAWLKFGYLLRCGEVLGSSPL